MFRACQPRIRNSIQKNYIWGNQIIEKMRKKNLLLALYRMQSEESQFHTKTNWTPRHVPVFELGGFLSRVSSSSSSHTWVLNLSPESPLVCTWEMSSESYPHTSTRRAQNYLFCCTTNHEQPSKQLPEKLNL
jgi:hypothetical protein